MTVTRCTYTARRTVTARLPLALPRGAQVGAPVEHAGPVEPVEPWSIADDLPIDLALTQAAAPDWSPCPACACPVPPEAALPPVLDTPEGRATDGALCIPCRIEQAHGRL